MTPRTITLPANLPLVYRAQVQGIVASLSHEAALGRASELLRSRIEKVTITYDPDAQRHQIAIEGDLRSVLELGGASEEPDDEPPSPGRHQPRGRSSRPS